MEQLEDWPVVRRTEVTVETHTLTTFRKRPCIDVEITNVEPETVVDTGVVAESREPMI